MVAPFAGEEDGHHIFNGWHLRPAKDAALDKGSGERALQGAARDMALAVVE